MFRVFVSYSSSDLSDVDLLKAKMQGSDIEVFIADHNVKPSSEFPREIISAIESSDLFVVVWSKNAKNSEWVSQEIGVAHGKNKKILPIVLDKGMSLPGFIKSLKYFECSSKDDDAFHQVKMLIIEAYEEHLSKLKLEEEKRKQKNKNEVTLIALTGFAFWLFSK